MNEAEQGDCQQIDKGLESQLKNLDIIFLADEHYDFEVRESYE